MKQAFEQEVWRQFRWFLAEILWREGLGFKPCSRSVFINRINSKLFKRGKEVKEEYAFSVDKKTHERKIRLCTWRDWREFPCGTVINYWRKEVNQGGSATFAIETYGSTKIGNPESGIRNPETESRNHGIRETETEYGIRERRFQAIDLKKKMY